MRIRTRGGEPEGSSAQRLDGEAAHLCNVVGGRVLEADRAVTHDIDAQRVMRELRADVDGARPALERVHEFGKRLPLPGQAVGEDDTGDLLNALHQIHKRGAMLRTHGRKAHAAVPTNNRGDSMPARGRQQRVPDRLPVIVGMRIDPAGADQEPARIYLPPRWSVLAADLRNALAGNAHVSGEARLAGAIDDGAAANDDVVHGNSPGVPLKSEATARPKT